MIRVRVRGKGPACPPLSRHEHALAVASSLVEHGPSGTVVEILELDEDADAWRLVGVVTAREDGDGGNRTLH